MPTTIKNNGKIIVVPSTIRNEMNKLFAQVGEKLGVEMTNVNDKAYINFLRKRQVFCVYLRPTDNQEITEIIACLNIRKSPGYIDIPTTLFKEAKYSIAPFLANSFNECIKSVNYLDILKIEKVFPLHKGGSKAGLNNYRPISILLPINKVFETILHRRLIKHRKKNLFFINCQFGFRKQHSTSHAIPYLHELILEQRDGNDSVSGIFVDVAKTFGCVDHQIL